MAGDGGDPVLERAHDAAARGAWDEAFVLFTDAQAAGAIAVADLPVFADVAYAAGHLDVTIQAWERAYADLLAVGSRNLAAGAAVRVAMHLLFDVALMAPVRAWLARAERLLDDGPDDAVTPPHAWLAVVRTYERMLSGDLGAARDCARRATDLGSQVDPAAHAIGRVAQARVLILDGVVDDGLALLDEAGLAAVSGQLDPLSTGVVYCELVCALQGLAQYDLAEQWTEAMERWSRTNAVGSVHGRCRVHRAEILRLRGSCREAEEQVLLACDELRPYVRRELGWPLSELGQIRLRRGDLVGAAEALGAARDAGWLAEPGLSLVRLARGDVGGATASIRDALARPSHVPSKELPPCSELRRAPLLHAQVEIAAASGDVAAAGAAAEALAAIAARFESRALRASAAHANGRVRLVNGDAVAAARLFGDAAAAWTEIGAPYETALARLGLAEAHRAIGNEERAALEQQAARTTLDHLEDVAEPGRSAGAPPRHSNVFRREGDYWTVVFEGHAAHVRDIKGMHYLARTLAAPCRELHVVDLVVSEGGTASGAHAFGDAGDMLDAAAKDAYRRRLAEIDDDIDEARANGDELRAAQGQTEREFLVTELARAVGLGGRDRRAGSQSERARASVTQALRKAMARLRDIDPALGEHLDRTVRTGTYCAYLPDPRLPPAWKL
jgi:hypothetical protein